MADLPALKLPANLTLEPDPHNPRVLLAQVYDDGCTDDVLVLLVEGDRIIVHGWGRTGPPPEFGVDRMRYVQVHPEDLQGAVDYVLGLFDAPAAEPPPSDPPRYSLVTLEQEPVFWACPVGREDELRRLLLYGRVPDWAVAGDSLTFTDPQTETS